MTERASTDGKLQPGAPNDPVPFGKYYLLGLIARGGMAEVYRARLRPGETDNSVLSASTAKRLLAIKVMRPQLAREARFVDMFNREGQLALMLRNRCIVETVEIGRIEGRHYIAMEYIGGRDLTQVLRRCQEANQRIPVPHAVYIAARIAEGLHFAHTLSDGDGRPLNIVNRDVSPSNVRMSYDGDVKLLDFGIAQALMKFTSEIGVLKGKFSYMSPEQIRGMPLDARTDVFSTGIILHEMLTTEKLFRGDTEFALMEKVRKADVPTPSNFNRRVTPEIDAIVLRALARDVADRYQNASALAADLDALIAGYRFDPKELRQFMRQLFRKEYAKEIDETQQALESKTLDEIAAEDHQRAITAPPVDAITPSISSGPTQTAPSRARPPSAPPPQAAAPGPTARPSAAAAPADVGVAEAAAGGDDDKPRGFFASLFKRKK
ncbi:MAG: serine/threonine protein kinase [Kofleriaceae bacterium]|nr:serine/threonine protein kinase [Kofleriaceae bacterium]